MSTMLNAPYKLAGIVISYSFMQVPENMAIFRI